MFAEGKTRYFDIFYWIFFKNRDILSKLLQKYTPEMEMKSGDHFFFFFGCRLTQKNPCAVSQEPFSGRFY